jgi:uncharacterized protein YegP (UPF0339 family)
MPAKYELKKGKSGKFHFNLLAANGEVILTSQSYTSKAAAHKGIASVQKHASQSDRYERRTGKKNKPHFVLKSANHRVIGSSETYEANSAMEKGIKSVMKNGSAKRVDYLA